MKINVRHQTTDPGTLEDTRKDKYKKSTKTKTKTNKTTHRHIIFKLRKSKGKQKILERNQAGLGGWQGETLLIVEQG